MPLISPVVVPSDNVFSIPSFTFYSGSGNTPFPMSNSRYYRVYDLPADVKIILRKDGTTGVQVLFACDRVISIPYVTYEIKTLVDSVYQSGSISTNGTYTYDGNTVRYNTVNHGLTSSESHDYGIIDLSTYDIAVDTSNGPQQAWLSVYGGYTATNITYNLTNCTGSADNPTLATEGEPFTVVFNADSGYTFHDITNEVIIIGGHMTAATALSGGTIGFTVVADVVPPLPLSITFNIRPANVIYNLTNCSKYSGTSFADPGDDVEFELRANEGYQFLETSVTAQGGTLEGAPLVAGKRYVGTVTIPADGNTVVITANLGTDPYETIGGEDDPESEEVEEPGTPGIGAITAGVIGLFNPSVAQMSDLASYMWTDFGTGGTTTEDILQEIVEAIKRTISNPLNYIVGLSIIPSQGLSVGTSQLIRFGFMYTNVTMPKLTSQFFTVDCGSIYFDYECGNTFLDYAPYSKFTLYLPYIGAKEIDANDCVGHTVGVSYRGDCVTGGVIAFVTVDGSVRYQFSGCCAINIPLSSDSWGQTIGAAVTAATAIIAGAYAGGAAGAAAAAAKNAASIAANPSLLSPTVQHSGSVTGSAGALGVQYPYMIRQAVRFHSTEGFNRIKGYPSGYYRRLGELRGYTTVIESRLSNIPALQDEIEEITTLLREGVIL